MDLIAHITDWSAFIDELGDLVAIENGKTYFLFDHTPFIQKGNEALVYLRNAPGSFAGMSSVRMLGDYTAALKAPTKKAIYDRIYPRTPVIMTDPEGNEHTYTPPERFGVFAD